MAYQTAHVRRTGALARHAVHSNQFGIDVLKWLFAMLLAVTSTAEGRSSVAIVFTRGIIPGASFFMVIGS